MCQERAGVAQRFNSRRPIEFGEIYDSACTGESIGNDRFSPLAEFEGNDERWCAQFHALPILHRFGSRNRTSAISRAACAKGRRALRSPDVDGLVYVQGINTIEETCYFLSLTVHIDKPIVVTGCPVRK